MSLILDIVTLAVILGSIFIAYKNGFLKSLIKMAGKIVALIIAYFAAGPISQIIDSKLINPWLSNMFLSNLEKNSVNTQSAEEFKIMVEDAPAFLENILEKFNTSIAEISNKVSETSANYVEQFVDQTVSPISAAISFAIAFLIIFFMALVVVNLLAKLAGKVNKIPVLKTVNKTLGIFLGLLNGLLIMFILAFAFKMAIPHIESLASISIDHGAVHNTFIYKFFEYYNPISIILNR